MDRPDSFVTFFSCFENTHKNMAVGQVNPHMHHL